MSGAAGHCKTNRNRSINKFRFEIPARRRQPNTFVIRFKDKLFIKNSLILKAVYTRAVALCAAMLDAPVRETRTRKNNVSSRGASGTNNHHTGKATPVARRGRKAADLGTFKKAGLLPNSTFGDPAFYLSAANLLVLVLDRGKGERGPETAAKHFQDGG